MVPENYFEWNFLCLRTLGFGHFLQPKLESPARTTYDYYYTTENFSIEYVVRHAPAIAVMMWVPGGELWGFIEVFGDAELMVASLMFLVYQSIMLTKFVWYFARGKNMRLLAYLIEVETKSYYQDWTLIRKAIKLTHRVLIGGYTLVILTVVTGCLASIKVGGDEVIAPDNSTEASAARSRAMDLPFIMPMPFPVENSWLFALAFLLQAVPLCCFGMMFFAADLFIFSCMVHLATQFHVLQRALANMDRHALRDLLGESVMMSLSEAELDDMVVRHAGRLQPLLERHLLSCVKHHQLLLVCCDLLERTYSPGFFAHFLNGICAVVLGIIAMNSNDALDVGKLLVFWYLSTTLLNLATLCWAGNEVTYQSLAVGGAVLHSRWYAGGARWRRAAVMLTLRAQRPVHLTAGKFIILSLGSFINTLKAAYSYNTMLSRTST